MVPKQIAVCSITMTLLLLFSFPVWNAARVELPWSSCIGVAHAQTTTFEALKAEPSGEVAEVADPVEPLNRFWFQFNDKMYFWVVKPIALGYNTVMPEPLRTAIDNVAYNFHFPVRFVNNLLQLKPVGAGTELASFVINSTIGFGGMYQPAQKEFKLKRYKEDFGQTLGFYHIPATFYIVWPVIGPSNLRDTFGRAGDALTNPVYWLVDAWLITGGSRVGEEMNSLSLHLGEYEDFKKSALDPYVSMRSAYHQYRENQIKQ
jgi:phospholipid-binding lipoprotein MlaA